MSRISDQIREGVVLNEFLGIGTKVGKVNRLEKKMMKKENQYDKSVLKALEKYNNRLNRDNDPDFVPVDKLPVGYDPRDKKFNKAKEGYANSAIRLSNKIDKYINKGGDWVQKKFEDKEGRFKNETLRTKFKDMGNKRREDQTDSMEKGKKLFLAESKFHNMYLTHAENIFLEQYLEEGLKDNVKRGLILAGIGLGAVAGGGVIKGKADKSIASIDKDRSAVQVQLDDYEGKDNKYGDALKKYGIDLEKLDKEHKDKVYNDHEEGTATAGNRKDYKGDGKKTIGDIEKDVQTNSLGRQLLQQKEGGKYDENKAKIEGLNKNRKASKAVSMGAAGLLGVGAAATVGGGATTLVANKKKNEQIEELRAQLANKAKPAKK